MRCPEHGQVEPCQVRAACSCCHHRSGCVCPEASLDSVGHDRNCVSCYALRHPDPPAPTSTTFRDSPNYPYLQAGTKR